MKNALGLLILVVFAGVVVGGVKVSTAVYNSEHGSCQQRLQADEAKVNTNHESEFAKNVPGLGDYVEIHWQYQALSDPCGRQPHPISRQYQGLVRLRADDLRTMTANFNWQPMPYAPEAVMWAPLVPFAPADPHWLHSQTYTDAYLLHGTRGDLYLDEASGVVFVSVLDGDV